MALSEANVTSPNGSNIGIVDAAPYGIPPGRWGDSFDSWRGDLAPLMGEAVAACQGLLEGGRRCVFLLGGTGNGKTHLAIATIRSWGCSPAARNGRGEFPWAVEFLKVPEWLSDLRRLYAENGGQVDTTIALYASSVGLVVLDDLGAGRVRATDWGADVLYRVIDGRYDRGLATLVTSNSRLEDLDPRIVSRLREGLVVCRAPDLRGRKI